jgi:hypothetical protein
VTLALTAEQVAEALGYLHRRGGGNATLIRSMYREGAFPSPIDPGQPVIRWRWSRAVVEGYVAGDWSRADGCSAQVQASGSKPGS